jgi:hypothetical protein
MRRDTKRRLWSRSGIVVTVVLLALVVALSLTAIAWADDDGTVTQELGTLKIAKVITGDTPEGGPWTQDDFSITVTGPNGYSWTGSFPAVGPIVLTDLVPGEYIVTENNTGESWVVTGEGAVTVTPGPGQTGLVITNTGSTTTTTEEETTTTTEAATTTTATETTVTTAPPTTASTTPIPSDIATGGGGTAGLGTGIYALIALAGILGAGLVGNTLRLIAKRK